jgi:hypothetical protein
LEVLSQILSCDNEIENAQRDDNTIRFPDDFEYKPYSSIALFAFNPMSTNPETMWKFLGHQEELKDAQVSYPPYKSQGNFLSVGARVSNSQFEPLVPRRGDVIVRREAWDSNYHHNVNFWYSMVKWHRGKHYPFVRGDMLVRRFISDDQQIDDNPILGGWAEMYEYLDFQSSGHSWIFWGRTRQLYDKPCPDQKHELEMKNKYPEYDVIKYTCDKGDDSDDDLAHEMVNPRRS